jgi:hypothetical protein
MNHRNPADSRTNIYPEKPRPLHGQPPNFSNQQMPYVKSTVSSLRLSNSFVIHPKSNEISVGDFAKTKNRVEAAERLKGDSSRLALEMMKENWTSRFFMKKNMEMRSELGPEMIRTKKSLSKTQHVELTQGRFLLGNPPKSSSTTSQTSGTESDLETSQVTISQKTVPFGSNVTSSSDKLRAHLANAFAKNIMGNTTNRNQQHTQNTNNDGATDGMLRKAHPGNRTSIFQEIDSEAEKTPISVSRAETPKLSFTMKEFPDEINPAEFFQQKFNCFHQFIDFAEKHLHINPAITLYHFNHEFDAFFIPFAIQLKGSSNSLSRTSYVPLAFSYFLASCPDVVQLYFAHELMSMFLRELRPIPVHALFHDCKRLLDKLSSDISTTRYSVASRNNHRKSLFSNNQTNFVIEDFDDLKEHNDTRPDDMKAKAYATPLLVQTPLFSERHLGPVKKSEARVDEPNQNNSSMNLDFRPNSKQKSLSSSESSSSDSESQSSSSEDDSLDENEYQSKNPYATQYSRLKHKFDEFEVKVTPPQFRLRTGELMDLTREQLEDLLFNFRSFSG